MKSWWESLLELILLIPLKLLELLLNCFAFIILVITSAIIKIIDAFKK